jgi:hypothetical protein
VTAKVDFHIKEGERKKEGDRQRKRGRETQKERKKEP